MQSQQDPKLEQKLRKAKPDQVSVLRMLARSEEPITSGGVELAIETAGGQALGGILSSLSRIKTEKGSLIKAVGSDWDGKTRWVLNEDVISREDLKKIVTDIDRYNVQKYQEEEPREE